MGQTPIFTTCPVCGQRNGLTCYGVIHHDDGAMKARYFRCRRCGARMVRKYWDDWRILPLKRECHADRG